MNGLQVFPNVIGLLGLSGVVATAARRRRAVERGTGIEPV